MARILASGLIGLALVTGAMSGVFAHPGVATGARLMLGASRSGAVRAGEVNLATLPPASPAELKAAEAGAAPRLAPKSAAQAAAYQRYVVSHPGALPRGAGGLLPLVRGPDMYGGGAEPVLLSEGEGLHNTTGSPNVPDPAVAAAPSYVFEMAEGQLEVFNTAYGLKFGPWTSNQFFATVVRSGDTVLPYPQISYDAERSIYLISSLEYDVNAPSHTFVDIAISKTGTPSPLTNFYVYQIDPNTLYTGTITSCQLDTLGYDYWGLYITCPVYNVNDFQNPMFIGNVLMAFSTNNLLKGSLGRWDAWFNVPTSLNCGSGCTPAYWLSPVQEDGVPQAEWVIATDQSNSATSQNLTVCALTNTIILGSIAQPTFTCGLNTLPLTYNDPAFASVPGASGALDTGFGFKQLAYRDGQLYVAISLAMTCSNSVTQDGILWAAVDPQLTTFAAHNPQWVNGIATSFTNAGYFCMQNADLYTPVLVAGTEGDMALAFGASSATIYPSVYFTGRAAEDAPGTMGQGEASHVVVSGQSVSVSGASVWGFYSACSLTTNLVSRSIVYCANQFNGPAAHSGPGWDTELYALRME
ncbi:MAG TPA: hypothetical protein VF808_19595 [Ktedonobacterales bacterium]